MSYGSPNPKRRAAGGGSIVFFVILLIGGFLLFSNLRGGGGGEQEPAGAGSGEIDFSPPGDLTREDRNKKAQDFLDEQPLPPKKQTAGGFDSTDVDVTKSDTSAAPGSVSTKSSGGFETSDVDTPKGKNPLESKAPEKAPTKSGDWATEDVKGSGGK